MPAPLDCEQLAHVLHDAFRMRPPANWGRAAPSALCWHALDVYALTAQGTFRYEPHRQALVAIGSEDLRAASGNAAYAAAPVVLVYVANLDHVHQAHAEEHGKCPGVEVDRLVESICACCAESGLDSVAHGRLTPARLGRALGLQPTEKVVLAQAIGLPVTHGA